jgi:mevalonate kinase
MMPLKTYPAKIMLAGEYGVVVGGGALTIPFPGFSARVRETADIPREKAGEAQRSRQYLADMYRYVSGLGGEAFHATPDLEKFSREQQEYWLDMDIPAGYGLGSSGVVSAAIYDMFFQGHDQLTLQDKRQDLAAIESFFHGRSSGVDPLTCHTGAPLHFREDGTIEQVSFNASSIPGGYRFFLLDSGERFDTGPLVQHFLGSMEDNGFASSIRNEYLATNRKLIESLLGIREADPALLVRVISDFQFTHFRKMIPDRMIDPWIEGQVSNEYYLKLNGSGGGFMLGITHSNSAETLEERWKQKIIWII